MPFAKSIALIAVVAFMPSCPTHTEYRSSDFVLSLYPPYSDEQTFVDESWLGRWVEIVSETGDEGTALTISNPEGNVLLVCTSSPELKETIVNFGRFTRIRDRLVLVLKPGTEFLPFNDFFEIPAYVLVQVDGPPQDFRSRSLAAEWLIDDFQAVDELNLSIEDTGDQLVVTSKSAEFRDFLEQVNWDIAFTPWTKFNDDNDENMMHFTPGVFDCPGVLLESQIPPPPPPPPAPEENQMDKFQEQIQ